MDYKFKHSLVVMGQLAQKTARTPPSEDDPSIEYVDRSLTILGRSHDTLEQRMQQEFLGQCEFIASEIRRVEKKMDERFEEVDGRFDELEKKMDGRFDKQEGEIRDVKVQLENAAVVTRNGRLRRMISLSTSSKSSNLPVTPTSSCGLLIPKCLSTLKIRTS